MSCKIDEIVCSDYLDLLKSVPDGMADVAICDPPFGISYANNYTKNQYPIIKGDESQFSYYELGKELYRILKVNTPIFIFTGWSEYPDHYKQLEACGFSMKEPIICQKRASGKTDLYGSFQSNCDWIIFAHKGRFTFKKTKLVKNKRAGTIPNKGRKPVPDYKTRFPSCWFGGEYPWSTENSVFQKKHNIYHPTIKGRKFIEWLIQLSTEENGVVVDPFVGVGTTAVACKRLNRRFIAGDIDSNFCLRAEKRLENALLETSGVC